MPWKILKKLGQGAHSQVFLGECENTHRQVAMKRCVRRDLSTHTNSNANTTFIPLPLWRECQILLNVQHENVIQCWDIWKSDECTMYLILELMQSDLAALLEKVVLKCDHIKQLILSVLHGLAYLHESQIMHRDLKPANILIAKSGMLKIADFGLARMCDATNTHRPYSHQIATRWYRAPEILYAARHYNCTVDMWAVGCILAEMVLGAPLFQGQNDIDQLHRVLSVLGSPNKDSWPEMATLPDYNKISFPHMNPIPWSHLFSANVDSHLIHLLSKCLVYSGSKRISAIDALMHPFFFTSPLPCSVTNIAQLCAKIEEEDNTQLDFMDLEYIKQPTQSIDDFLKNQHVNLSLASTYAYLHQITE